MVVNLFLRHGCEILLITSNSFVLEAYNIEGIYYFLKKERKPISLFLELIKED
jgi:hypothetical protein